MIAHLEGEEKKGLRAGDEKFLAVVVVAVRLRAMFKSSLGMV